MGNGRAENHPASQCDQAREILSAGLDGEGDAGPSVDSAHRHLAECAECARWVDEVTRLDRTLRVGGVVDHEADHLVESVLARTRLPRRGRTRPLLRATLILVACAQLVLGLVDLIEPVGMSMPGMAMPHLDHEEAAFNIAFGIALAMVAWNGRRALGQVPVLSAFVLVLAVSSIVDLADGAVTWSRLLTHLPIVLGLLLSAVLGRMPEPVPGPLTRTARGRAPWRHPRATVRREGAASESDRRAAPATRRDVA